ncbi:MAG: FG-GAP-like repeat-containing protein [Gilvibacter sp.]
MKKIMLSLLAICATAGLQAQMNVPYAPIQKGGVSTVTFSGVSVSTSGTNRAVVDMNGDFLDDIVSISTSNVNILQQQAGGGFITKNISTTSANYTPSWSLAAADYNADGFTDLLYGGGSGVTFMRSDGTGNGFVEVSGSEFVFSQRSNFVDINNDGHLDAFVCHDVEPNVYYINDGSGNLTFNQGGLGDYPSGGHYGSVWIDYDNDGDIDMFIAKCGGETARRTNQMWRNNGDGSFTEVGVASGLADPMQTWSSAWGDYDNDGDMDVFVGASSGTHKLMRNNGDGTFTNVTSGSGVSSVTATGIENATHDFNNDGNLDIASNGTILYGNGNMTFTEIQFSALSSSNGAFGDLNKDGFIDAFNSSVVRYNGGNDNHWVTINLVGDVSNINGIGARIEVTTASGTQIRDVRSGEGFRFLSTLNTHVGLAGNDVITSLTVKWPSGIVDTFTDLPADNIYEIHEGMPLAVDDNVLTQLSIYPNPATEILNITSTSPLNDAAYTVFTVDGKRVMSGKIQNDRVNVASLAAGTYILRIANNNAITNQQFIKR